MGVVIGPDVWARGLGWAGALRRLNQRAAFDWARPFVLPDMEPERVRALFLRAPGGRLLYAPVRCVASWLALDALARGAG